MKILQFPNSYFSSYVSSLSLSQIHGGACALVITGNIVMFTTIWGFFKAFDNEDGFEYSTWWEMDGAEPKTQMSVRHLILDITLTINDTSYTLLFYTFSLCLLYNHNLEAILIFVLCHSLWNKKYCKKLQKVVLLCVT